MILLDFKDLLKQTLQVDLPTYTTQIREPWEGELAATNTVKQIWITREGFSNGEDIADLGQTTALSVPVFVSIVMQRPKTEAATRLTDQRAEDVIRACRKAVNIFNATHAESGALVNFMQEQSVIVEGFLVSVMHLDIEYDLGAEDT